MSRCAFQSMMRWLSLAGLAVCVGIAIWGFRCGVFTSQQALAAIVARNAIVSALLFILLQIVQVVIPILPGGVSCLAGGDSLWSIQRVSVQLYRHLHRLDACLCTIEKLWPAFVTDYLQPETVG